MNAAEIVSIITVCVTLILGVGGFVINSFVQRRNNSIAIITKTRMERRTETQEIISTILSLTDYDYNKVLSEEEKKNTVKEVVVTVNKLVSKYFYSFPRDAEFLDTAKNLKKLFCETKQNWVLIEKAREDFERISTVYIYTDWKRIKLETTGKHFQKGNNLPSWEKIYDNTLSYFDDNYKPTPSSLDDNYLKK